MFRKTASFCPILLESFEVSQTHNATLARKNVSNHQTSLEEAIESLLSLSVIKKDQETSAFSFDCLDSTSLRKSLTLEQRKNAFAIATALVAKEFPQRGSYDATLYAMWRKCASYLPHVLHLKNCFREEHAADPSFIASPLYCDLNNMC